MIASVSSPCLCPRLEELQTRFLTLLPRIETHARIYFRFVRCADRKQDCIHEVIALAWKWFCRLAEKGKDARAFVMTLAALAARSVGSGRRLCGQEKAKDVMSPLAQRRHGFTVEELPHSTRRSFEDVYALVHGQQEADAYEERLQDNTMTPPPDAAAFRIDFPRFLASLTQRDRQLAMFLSLGHPARTAAAKFNLSPGRVTQLRQTWCREWRLCQGEEDALGSATGSRPV